MAEKSEKKGFWASLPGVITALTGLITAVAGIVFGLFEIGVLGGREPDDPDDPVVLTGDLTEGWTIIGEAKGRDYRNMLIFVEGDAPARGRVYMAVEDFRLISQSPQEIGNGGQTITLGMVCKGDRVKVLDLFIPVPSTRKQFVHAKLEAELTEIGEC